MTIPLFDDIRAVGEQIQRAPHRLLCLDFDGTLTPLVEHPAEVSLPPHTQRALLTLAGRAQLSLAIISGRDRADLQTRIGIPELIYAGNHGLEISGPGCLFVEPTSASHCEALQELIRDLTEKLAPIPGTLIENKGLTASIHYRQVDPADFEEVRRIVHSELSGTQHPFHLTTGNKVFEIRPRVYWNKGTAVAWIKDHVGQPDTLIMYLGDDTTDEDVFTALPEAITVKVGDPRDSAARYHLECPAEVRRFLEWLADLLQPVDATAPIIL